MKRMTKKFWLYVSIAIFLIALLGALTSYKRAAREYQELSWGSNFTTQNLTGTRGKQIFWEIDTGKSSMKGYWIGGIEFDLENRGTGYNIALPSTLESKPWPNTIETTSSGNTSSIIIRGSITVPDVPNQENQSLIGSVKGKISYPKFSGGGQYAVEEFDLNVPLQLNIVSPNDYIQKEAEWRRSHIYWVYFWLTITIIAAVISINLWRK